MSQSPLLLLDSASLYYRSYFALPESMTAPDGRPHNAIRGFLTTIARLAEQYRPAQIAACWDDDWRPQWRVDLLPSYKTHRLAEGGLAVAGEQTPDTLVPQAEGLAQILDAMGVARPGAIGYEADDIIATLAGAAERPSIVVSGDRDLVQLVASDVQILMTVNGGMDKWPLLDPAGVLERFGVGPQQYVDLAVLRGDPSDGIPGVPGIGAKTASALITAHGSIEALLDAVADGKTDRPLTPRLAGLLAENRELIAAMKHVATARFDAPITCTLEAPTVPADAQRLRDLGEQWGVSRYIEALMAAFNH